MREKAWVRGKKTKQCQRSTTLISCLFDVVILFYLNKSIETQ